MAKPREVNRVSPLPKVDIGAEEDLKKSLTSNFTPPVTQEDPKSKQERTASTEQESSSKAKMSDKADEDTK